MSLVMAVEKVRQTPFVVDVLRTADELAVAAAAEDGRRAARILEAAATDPADELTAVAAVHALGRMFDDEADAVLSELLSHDRGFLREHAAWALGSRLPRLDAVGRLVALVVHGGFSGMLAQRTLEQWARSASDHVALAVEGALAAHDEPHPRARLVETLGLVPGPVAGRALRQAALDEGEHRAARVAALASLGDRTADPSAAEVVTRMLAAPDGELAATARLAALDLGLAPPGPAVPQQGDRQTAGRRGRPDGGLRVAQLFLHADLDRELSRAGAGDNGGIATLLVRLGDALAQEPGVGQVLTLSRGTAATAVAGLADVGSRPGHVLVPVPLDAAAYDASGVAAPRNAADAWPARVAAQRGIRRALRASGGVDVLHLRMADVGSMAAAAAAAALDVPVVFTLAPDPHAVVHALDMTGALTRADFGSVDESEHYWFRARLVQRLAAEATHTVLFPRPELRHDLRELLGVDVEDEAHRYTVVPEGIDVSVTDAAAAERGALTPRARAAGEAHPAFGELEDLVAALPEARRRLPLAVSVGRLHPVKGMATLVEVWAGDPGLHERCNLLLVGGDLGNPSGDERGQLERIEAVLDRQPATRDGLLLPGHRPNDVVARWLAAARSGTPGPGGVAPGGVYVCGSLKEEFGLALLEALAAGLVVLAPGSGGPATYVEDGVTGVLVDTADPRSVGRGWHRALELAAGRPPALPTAERVSRARDLVDREFTVQAMARTLTGVYTGASTPVAR